MPEVVKCFDVILDDHIIFPDKLSLFLRNNSSKLGRARPRPLPPVQIGGVKISRIHNTVVYKIDNVEGSRL
jgi:hypothetical protein